MFNILKESSHQKHRSSHRNRTGSAWLLAFLMCSVYEFLHALYQASAAKSPKMSLVRIYGIFEGQGRRLLNLTVKLG